MVTKKKRLCLGLLLSLFGIGNAMQAGRLFIENGTQNRVTLKIKYHEDQNCPSEKGELGPGGRRGFVTELCNIKSVQARVYTSDYGVIRTKKYRVRRGEKTVRLRIEELASRRRGKHPVYFIKPLPRSKVLVGSGVVQENKVTIKNRTSNKVKFKISYYGERKKGAFCLPDTGVLDPETSKNIRSGLCAVKKVEAEVRYARIQEEPSRRIRRPGRAKVKYSVPFEKMGNSTWVISGPFYDRGSTKYKITGGLDS